MNLSDRIYKFVSIYGAISPNWIDDDVDDEKYTSPDVYEMLTCAELLKNNITPKKCWSDWGSGGYKPHTSIEGKKEHDIIVKEIYKLINK